MNELIGKEVQIFPGDTREKFGKIVEITDGGILFKITRSGSPNYIVGKLRFIAYSAKLTFQII